MTKWVAKLDVGLLGRPEDVIILYYHQRGFIRLIKYGLSGLILN